MAKMFHILSEQKTHKKHGFNSGQIKSLFAPLLTYLSRPYCCTHHISRLLTRICAIPSVIENCYKKWLYIKDIS